MLYLSHQTGCLHGSPVRKLSKPNLRCLFFSFVLCNTPAPEEKSGHDLPGSRCHTGLRSPAISCFLSHSVSFPSLQHAVHGEGRLVTKRKQWLVFLHSDAKPVSPVHTRNAEISKYVSKMSKGFRKPSHSALLGFF